MGIPCVLIADDQPDITRMLKIVLKNAHFEVLIAEDGVQARLSHSIVVLYLFFGWQKYERTTLAEQ